MTNVTAATGKERYKTQIKTDHHTLIVDEPLEVGGANLGPKPSDLLAASLASCTAITLRMYADRKGWDLQETMVNVTLENHALEGRADFKMDIRLFGNLDTEQRAKLLEIAGKCPIHRILKNEIDIQTVLKD
ncbi:OsmC family protein [Flavobacterium caeni]|uniref:Putative redox protein n=1 Tax=Flavobacterium caeni TaxID=490189 RepID=A0A1G5BN62_9FLAO|nr:OsmC family protein [Flavobacterium caeni]SCX91675.1 putative redox protein [Flavobacterium caeni]